MATVARRDEPRKFLDASLVPLEHALLARAQVLDGAPPKALDMRAQWLADELRALADELHHW